MRAERRLAPVIVALVVVAAATLGESTAWGQAEDQAGARSLFQEARSLMQAGKYESACPKLEAARKMYEGSGVLLNLGDCYEHVGRTASAWTTFGEAAAVAARQKRRDDEAEATRRQAALDPKLSRLSIRVAKDLPGLAVKRDGILLERAAWGTAMPVHPGPHAVTAEAPHWQPWSTNTSVTEPGKTFVVEIPELVATESGRVASTPPPASTPTPAADAEGTRATYWTGQRVVGVAVAGAGVVALGVGGILGLAAKSNYDDATAQAGAARRDDSASAVKQGNIATVIVIAGAALAVGGAVLWLSAPSASGPAAVGTNGQDFIVRF